MPRPPTTPVRILADFEPGVYLVAIDAAPAPGTLIASSVIVERDGDLPPSYSEVEVRPRGTFRVVGVTDDPERWRDLFGDIVREFGRADWPVTPSAPLDPEELDDAFERLEGAQQVSEEVLAPERLKVWTDGELATEARTHMIEGRALEKTEGDRLERRMKFVDLRIGALEEQGIEARADIDVAKAQVAELDVRTGGFLQRLTGRVEGLLDREGLNAKRLNSAREDRDKLKARLHEIEEALGGVTRATQELEEVPGRVRELETSLERLQLLHRYGPDERGDVRDLEARP